MSGLSHGANLTAEEMAALREAVAPEPSRDPAPVSLVSADRKARRKLKALTRVMADVVIAFRAKLARDLRVALPMNAQEFELSAAPAMEAAAAKWLMTVKVKNTDGQAVMAVGVSSLLGYQLIELAYGAPLTSARPPPARVRLTEVEKQTLRPFLDQITNLFCRHFFPASSMQTAYELHEHGTPLSLDVGSDSGLISGISFEIGGRPMEVGFALLPAALDLVGDVSLQSHAEAHANLCDSLKEVDVELIANLGAAKVPVSVLSTLAVGDLLWLDHSQKDPVLVSVQGSPKFLAQPMQRAGAVGVQIVTRI